ncbi:MAG: hypothetical protein ACI9G1_003384, partial [Pirellulaceae bacterium]
AKSEEATEVTNEGSPPLLIPTSSYFTIAKPANPIYSWPSRNSVALTLRPVEQLAIRSHKPLEATCKGNNANRTAVLAFCQNEFPEAHFSNRCPISCKPTVSLSSLVSHRCKRQTKNP